MIENQIRKKRQKLNESIAKKESYEKIYEISVELDELIAKYYREEKKRMKKNKNNQATVVLK